jgi:hypothetical protein
MGLPRAATNLEQRRLGQRHLGQRHLGQRRLGQRRLGQRRLRQRRKKPNPLEVPKGNPLMSNALTRHPLPSNRRYATSTDVNRKQPHQILRVGRLVAPAM